MHKRYGKLPWHTLFAKPIALAEQGFAVRRAWPSRLSRIRNICSATPKPPPISCPAASRIIGCVAKTLTAHIDRGMDIQTAIDLPNRLHRGSVYELEENTAARYKSVI
ncbi:gamma-glutamyltransferase [Neisseria leonii]|uniref:gamma-glutamyltransferase n=1 Tax=Neisseria leonii TaxID=2995413 RepID=UPI00345F796D